MPFFVWLCLQVVSINSKDGPAGVTVQLRKGADVIAESKTEIGGSYQFSPVLPGTYTLHASHPR